MRKRTTRVVTVADPADPTAPCGPARIPQPGEIYCLVAWQNLAPNRGAPRHSTRGAYLTTDPRTNLSHETRWEGYLGTTNDVHEQALGAYRVVSATPADDIDRVDGPRWRVSLAPVEQQGG